MRVAVIGGGPSGLVTLKYLLTAHEYHAVEPIDVRLFETKDTIGGTFRYRVYEDAEVDLCLISKASLTSRSSFRRNTLQRSQTLDSHHRIEILFLQSDTTPTLKNSALTLSYGRIFLSPQV
jgi:phytoene dehydrogenase-like protein